MTYIMSDIHGMYDKYMKMLELIELSDDDDLYILGDVVDRGDSSAEILLDMMNRPNVYPIIGNHEVMAIEVLDVLLSGEKEDQPASFDKMMDNWIRNGGMPTMTSISKLSYDRRRDVFDYLSEFTNYEKVCVDDKLYIMVHSGFDNFRPDRRLSDYSVDELIFHSTDPEFRYFDDENIFVISGHIPTININGNPEIIHNNGNILIDCGACFENGRLACLCLDTMEEFYT